MSDDLRAQLAEQFRRPTPTEAEVWSEETGERFTVVIVQPYVLAQRHRPGAGNVE